MPSDQTAFSLSSSVPQTSVIGGATVLSTTRTVQHWFEQTADPIDGVTYGYNMVGADPTSCTGTACSVTIQADITPVNVVVDGQTFDATQLINPLLASPIFATNDYGSTPYGSLPGSAIRGRYVALAGSSRKAMPGFLCSCWTRRCEHSSV